MYFSCTKFMITESTEKLRKHFLLSFLDTEASKLRRNSSLGSRSSLPSLTTKMSQERPPWGSGQSLTKAAVPSSLTKASGLRPIQRTSGTSESRTVQRKASVTKQPEVRQLKRTPSTNKPSVPRPPTRVQSPTKRSRTRPTASSQTKPTVTPKRAPATKQERQDSPGTHFFITF